MRRARIHPPTDFRRRRCRSLIGGTFALWVALPLIVGWGDQATEKVSRAQESYHAGDVEKARELFEEARETGVDLPELDYDLGVVLYRQDEWGEASEMFRRSLERGEGDLRPWSYFNLGNTLFQQGDYAGALSAYRRVLEMNPEDLDAKYNLELALKKLQETASQQSEGGNTEQQEQEQQQEEQGQEEGQDQQEQQEQSQPEEQQQEEQEQQQQEQEQQQQQEQSEESEESANQEESPSSPEEQGQSSMDSASDEEEMSPEDAERLLEALRNEESRTLEAKRREQAGARVRVSHDW